MWAIHLDCGYWGFHSTSTSTTRTHPLLPSYRLKFPLKCSRVFLHLLVYGVDVVCPRSPSGVRNRPVSQFGDDGWRESCNWPWTSETRPSCTFVLYSHHYPGITERCLLLRCWILTKSKLSDSLGGVSIASGWSSAADEAISASFAQVPTCRVEQRASARCFQ